MFIEFKKKQKFGKVTFGDNGCGHILGIDKIGKNFTSSIENIYLADGLKYNLFSISQLSDIDNHDLMIPNVLLKIP